MFSLSISGKALRILECIIFFDLKKGPILSKIFPLSLDDKEGPKILKITKLIIISKN
tara:strand:- start:1193 stop:1363 length:171 start_codon:yes stop_codon:yes gene_type:complete